MPGVIDRITGRGLHLGNLTAVLAERHGDRTAIEDDAATPGLHGGGPRSFAQLEDHVARLAAAHRAAGVERGDRVLVLLGNRIDVVLHAMAIARLGAVAAPTNPRLRAAEVTAIAEAAGARLAVADDPASAADLEVRTTDEVATWLDEHPGEGVLAPDADGPDALDPEATAVLLATSGTTGLPKAAALTSKGLLSSTGPLSLLPVGRERGPRAGRDLVLAALPLTHVMGLACALGCLAAGVPMLHRSRFDAVEVLDLVEARRPNLFIGVPTMYADLEAAGADDRDLSSVQIWASGADVMPPDRARRFQRRGALARVAGRSMGQATFVDGYGMVELSGAAALRVYPPVPLGRLQVPSFAIALPGMSVRAVDPDGNPVGPGKVGELQFRGSGVTKGYEGRDDSGPDADGWFSSGDFGRVWPGGLFQFAGRHHDRLKVGGFSVFPAEVEVELRDHPDVRDVAVVGLPDDRAGQRLAALVVVEDGATLDPTAWLDWAAGRVAGYRRPRAVAVVDALPRGNNGKLDRAGATSLAEELADDGALTTAPSSAPTTASDA